MEVKDVRRGKKGTESKLIVDKFKLNHFRGRSSSQLPSFILFFSVIILVNLFPFYQPEFALNQNDVTTTGTINQPSIESGTKHLSYLDNCIRFIRIMFTNPVNFNKRTLRSFQAEARVIGKMAKMWYIKKKIKKLSKKLKKHTIAVPVFTAIPIYEHSYYPQPHVTHVSHAGLHHAAAASSYSPAIASVQPAPTSIHPSSQQAQQMATSASSNHQQMAQAYRLPPAHHHHHPAAYHPSAAAHQIINSYAPSPPLYVDEAGGLYGHYGNAYGRYDGGYQMW